MLDNSGQKYFKYESSYDLSLLLALVSSVSARRQAVAEIPVFLIDLVSELNGRML
jgi:hypothetical protein